MTVSTLTNSVVYTGNGATTAFPVPFKVLDEDHLVVRRRLATTGDIDYTYIGTDYSYSGIGDDSGTLTLSGAALTSTYKLEIVRQVPHVQPLDIVNAGGFYPETVEEQLDLMIMQIQQIDAVTDRAILFPFGMEVLEDWDDVVELFRGPTGHPGSVEVNGLDFVTLELFSGPRDVVVTHPTLIPTSGTDNTPAFVAATTTAKLTVASTLIYAPMIWEDIGRRLFTEAMELNRIVNIRGAGSGFDSSGTSASTWYFPIDTLGIVTNSFDTFENTITANTSTSYGSAFDGLRLASAGGTDLTKHGFQMRTSASIRNCVFDNFPGNGINITAQAGGGALTRGNNNGWRLEHVIVKSCGQHGLFVSLSDSNAGYALGFRCLSAVRCGWMDVDTLGNLYLMSEIDGSASDALGRCSHTGENYLLIDDTPGIGQTVAPGANDNVWYPTGNLATFTAYDPLISYHVSMPGYADGSSNRGLALCTYTEGQMSHAGGEFISIAGQSAWTRKSKHMRGVLTASPAIYCNSGFGGYADLPLGTSITSLGTGTGGTGTYNVSPPQTVASTTITGVTSTGLVAVFTASIAAGVMNVTAVASGTIANGMRLTGTGVKTGTGSGFGTFLWTAIGHDPARGVILETVQQFTGHKNAFRWVGRSVVITMDSADVQLWGWSARGTTRKFGLTAAREGILFARQFALGDATGSGDDASTTYRIIHMAAAEPTSGEYARGQHVLNNAPSAGGTPGWVCTTGGTAGSTAVFKAMANLAA